MLDICETREQVATPSASINASTAQKVDSKEVATMSLLEHPIIATFIAGIILAILIPLGTWIVRRIFRPEIRVATAMEKGPTTHELGFTEPAVRITLANRSSKDTQIKDIRLMFCGHFGASIAPKAPLGRSHPELPVSLAAGSEEYWYIPAEKLSSLLRRLCHPPNKAGTVPTAVRLYARCMTGTNRVYKGPSFSFPTDPSSHWP